MGQHKKKKEFNDLLIPMIVVLAVMPFIIRLISYDTGLSKYSWYSDFDIVQDFFTYYKSYCFIFLTFVMMFIIIPYCLVQRGQRKDMKTFLPLGIYAFLVILSTIFSVDVHSSLSGVFDNFEGLLVLLGYLILLIYTYQINKKDHDYKVILKFFVLSLTLLSIIGIFQMVGKDLLYYSFFQKLIIPQSDWSYYVGNLKSHLSNNAVSLTLFNPNYASVFLSMVIPFLIALIFPEGASEGSKGGMVLTKVERIILSVLAFVLTILLFKTYSRTGLLSLVMALFVLLIFHRKLLKSIWKQCIILGGGILLLFVGIDSMNDFRYINKLIGTVQSFYDEEDSAVLEEILTKEQGIDIRVEGEEVTVSMASSWDSKSILEFKNSEGVDITSAYDSDTKQLLHKEFGEARFLIQQIDNSDYIIFELNDITWKFCKDQNEYVYLNDFGKKVSLTPVEQLGRKSLEDIGSGRGYIWSRTIPLLKDTLFIGKGPNTFLYVFPQSDYVGKANNCKTPVTLVEKPHNLYLMMGIQTGVLSVVAFVAFYLIYLVKSVRIYRRCKLIGVKERMGFGCFVGTLSYMISGFFTDSSIHTTPVFIILMGLGMDINYQLDKIRKNPNNLA